MIDTVFGIKVRMSGLSINRYRPIIGRLLDADYRLPYRCISTDNPAIFSSYHFICCLIDTWWSLQFAFLSYCVNKQFQTVKTASTIAASIVCSKLDYCNSLYNNLPKSQIYRLQQIQNCLARTVVKAPKSSHITHILRSLQWLKMNERIEYKLLSFTYKVLTTSQWRRQLSG